MAGAAALAATPSQLLWLGMRCVVPGVEVKNIGSYEWDTRSRGDSPAGGERLSPEEVFERVGAGGRPPPLTLFDGGGALRGGAESDDGDGDGGGDEAPEFAATAQRPDYVPLVAAVKIHGLRARDFDVVCTNGALQTMGGLKDCALVAQRVNGVLLVSERSDYTRPLSFDDAETGMEVKLVPRTYGPQPECRGGAPFGTSRRNAIVLGRAGGAIRVRYAQRLPPCVGEDTPRGTVQVVSREWWEGAGAAATDREPQSDRGKCGSQIEEAVVGRPPGRGEDWVQRRHLTAVRVSTRDGQHARLLVTSEVDACDQNGIDIVEIKGFAPKCCGTLAYARTLLQAAVNGAASVLYCGAETEEAASGAGLRWTVDPGRAVREPVGTLPVRPGGTYQERQRVIWRGGKYDAARRQRRYVSGHVVADMGSHVRVSAFEEETDIQKGSMDLSPADINQGVLTDCCGQSLCDLDMFQRSRSKEEVESFVRVQCELAGVANVRKIDVWANDDDITWKVTVNFYEPRHVEEAAAVDGIGVQPKLHDLSGASRRIGAALRDLQLLPQGGGRGTCGPAAFRFAGPGGAAEAARQHRHATGRAGDADVSADADALGRLLHGAAPSPTPPSGAAPRASLRRWRDTPQTCVLPPGSPISPGG